MEYPPGVCVNGKTQIKIDITLLISCDKVSNTLQHKVQKNILWLGRWVSPCRWCCYKLPMNAVNPDRLHLLTTAVFTIIWFCLVTPVALKWHPTFAFTSQSNVLWEKKARSLQIVGMFLFHSLHVFMYSLWTSFMFRFKWSWKNSAENEVWCVLHIKMGADESM